MLIRTLVKKNFEIVGPYAGTATIKKNISQKGAIVVMEDGNYMGILTSDDLVEKPHNLIIDCISSRPHIALTHSISEVLDIMKQSNTRILPVNDDEEFIGTIHYNDIMDYIAKIVDEQKMIVQTVAHDLKSPIASIMGLSSLLKLNLVKEENIELVNFAEQACNYATEIINDLLLIPQLEGDQDEENMYEITDINAFLNECIESMQVLASSKGIEVIKDISPQVFNFPIHRSKIKRAVHNLLSNAVKFTPANGYIGVSSVQSVNELLIKIKDSGIGIPVSTQPFIFNKFTKAKRAGTEGEKSIGLGLYITKQIIEQHNGQLWFDSDEQSGTTFYISLGKEDELIGLSLGRFL